MLLERAELLDQLTAFLAAAERGRGRLVIVGGEAGIGKTSLVRAFTDGAARRAEMLVGSCDSVVPARPFGPLHDIARYGRADLRAPLDTLDRDRILKVALDVAASGREGRLAGEEGFEPSIP